MRYPDKPDLSSLALVFACRLAYCSLNNILGRAFCRTGGTKRKRSDGSGNERRASEMQCSLGNLLTAMVTPFKPDLSVDYDAARKLAGYLLDEGSDGIVVSGTTGESPTLSFAEKLELFKVVRETVGERGNVVAGTGNYCTQESIELTRQAEAIGVDACMLVTPYYNKPPQPGLYQHFKTIAESTSLPVILYNVPSRTALNMDCATTIALSEVPNIVAVKEASGNTEQIARIVSGTAEDFIVYSGDDEFTLPLMALGGDGVISVAAHVAGKQIRQMVDAFLEGDEKEALRFHLLLLPLFKTLFMTTNPIMVKAALKLKGMEVGGLRLPLIEATGDQIERLRQVMVETGLLT
jgi:4-hydroxy-tetrahydrodipicolinate synthase